MRAERSIRRADLCVLIIDRTMGVTAQDKRIAGIIQKERKGAILVLNKWDLIRPQRDRRRMISRLVDETRERIFFLECSPVLIASVLTSENIDQLFAIVEKIRRAARQHTGTGVMNGSTRQTFVANPQPLKRVRRRQLLYAAQASGKGE